MYNIPTAVAYITLRRRNRKHVKRVRQTMRESDTKRVYVRHDDLQKENKRKTRVTCNVYTNT